MQNVLKSKVEKHLLACAAVAAAGAVVQQSEAAIVYSGLLNIAVDPTTPAGIYINVQGLSTGTSAFAGWDLNFFNITYSGNYTGLAFYPANVNERVVGTASGVVSKLAAGVTVGPASTLMTLNSNGIGAMEVFYPDGTAFGLPWTPNGVDGYVGFRARFPDNSNHFGWARLSVNAWNGSLGTSGAAPFTLVDFAYESDANTAITTGAGVPEPTSVATLGMLALGAISRRRK